jgi:hypothetical protein
MGYGQDWSGRSRKILPSLGFSPRTVQLVVHRYTDWAIPSNFFFFFRSHDSTALLSIGHGLRTCGTHAQNGTRKDFLGTRNSLMCQVVLCPSSLPILWRMCVCVYTHICVEFVFESPLLPDNTASGTFSHKSGSVWSVDWIFTIGTPGWRWRANTWHWTERVTVFCWNRK